MVYIGTHGDAGAHAADVILPGATYTEKAGTMVNLEGRPQRLARAAFAPGEAREDWAIIRALSAELNRKLPFDSLAALNAAMLGVAPWLGRTRRGGARRRRRDPQPGRPRRAARRPRVPQPHHAASTSPTRSPAPPR